MTTQADMIAEIQEDTARSDATSAVRRKIAAAIRHYQKNRFYFNESRDVTFPLVVDKSGYSVADVGAEFYTVDAIYITDAGGNVSQLQPQDYRWFETLEGNATSNQPYAWAYVNRTFRFYPPPNDAYTIRVTGHLKIGAPANDDTEGNEWFTEAYDLIMAGARTRLHAFYWKEPDEAAIMRVAEAAALGELTKATSAKVSTGHVVPTDF